MTEKLNKFSEKYNNSRIASLFGSNEKVLTEAQICNILPTITIDELFIWAGWCLDKEGDWDPKNASFIKLQRDAVENWINRAEDGGAYEIAIKLDRELEERYPNEED